jgi:hypothetical protein
MSSGHGGLAPRIAGFGIQAGEQFVGEGDTDHLFCLSGLGQPAVKGDEVGVVSADDFGDGEEDCADRGVAAAYGALAVGLAAVARQRSEADQLADGFVREGADLGHFGHHPRDGTWLCRVISASSSSNVCPMMGSATKRRWFS